MPTNTQGKEEEITIRVKKVEGGYTKTGKPRYVVFDKFDNKYATLDRDFGNGLKKAEGKLVLLKFVPTGNFKNITGFEVKPDPARAVTGAKPVKEFDNAEGQSFGNARNVASVIVGSLIEAGYFGDLTTKTGATKLDLGDVVETFVEITDKIEAARRKEPEAGDVETDGDTAELDRLADELAAEEVNAETTSDANKDLFDD